MRPVLHASAIRPFSANSPCGRFWMKMMMNTSTRDLREHRALPRLEELVGDAEAQRRVHRAGELADAAQHDDHERVDDVALPEVGTDVADLRQRAAGEPRDARAQAEREHVDSAGAARRAQLAIGRFCVTARTNRPSRVRVSSSADQQHARPPRRR